MVDQWNFSLHRKLRMTSVWYVHSPVQCVSVCLCLIPHHQAVDTSQRDGETSSAHLVSLSISAHCSGGDIIGSTTCTTQRHGCANRL